MLAGSSWATARLRHASVADLATCDGPGCISASPGRDLLPLSTRQQRPDGSVGVIGDIPPPWRNQSDPTAVDTPPTATASASLGDPDFRSCSRLPPIGAAVAA